MSMHYIGFRGYGFRVNEVTWKKEWDMDELHDFIVDEVILGTCVDLCYGEDLGDCVVISDCLPWESKWHEDLEKIKTHEDANDYLYDLFKEYIDMSEIDFKLLIDHLEDCYYG